MIESKTVKNYIPHKKLSPKIWNSDMSMKSDIKEKLLNISDAFIDYLGIPLDIFDVTMTGSYANYNYTPFSDIDLHILVDFDDLTEVEDLAKEFFNAKKSFWNDRHDIKIKGIEVELYAQDVNEPHSSTGVYSIEKDVWVQKPNLFKFDIDQKSIMKKFKMFEKDIKNAIEDAEENLDNEYVVKMLKKIKRMRKSGLEKGGEMSEENLIYKIIRDKGYLQKLFDVRSKIFDKNLSY